MKHLAAVVLVALAPSIPRPSNACSIAPPDYGPLELDPTFETDTVPPSAVDVTYNVYRRDGGGACGSCGDFSSINVALTATDDRATSERLGFRFRLVGGGTPPGMTLPDDDRVSDYGSIYWRFDSAYRGRISFDVEVRAVDLNGNVGPATVITIED